MTLYHATPAENVGSIEEDGLEARSLNQPIYAGMYGADETVSNGVYVTTSKEDAEAYAEYLTIEKELGGEREMVVFEIDVSARNGHVYPDPEGDIMGDQISKSGKILAANVAPGLLARISRVEG